MKKLVFLILLCLVGCGFKYSYKMTGTKKEPVATHSSNYGVTTFSVQLGKRDRLRLREVARDKNSEVIARLEFTVTPLTKATNLIRVFINKPDATMKTSSTSPHFAAYGVMSGCGDSGSRYGMVCEVSHAIRKLSKLGKLNHHRSVQVTFVVGNLNNNKKAKLDFKVEHVNLTFHRLSDD